FGELDESHALVAVASNDFHRRSVSIDTTTQEQERPMGAVMVRCPETGRDIPTGLVTDRKSFDATPVFFARVYCPICRTENEWFRRGVGWLRSSRAGSAPSCYERMGRSDCSPRPLQCLARVLKRSAARGDGSADHDASAPILAEMIRSGSATGSPRLILSTFPMPSVTLPQTVYLPLRKGASAKQMKNWLSPASRDCARAMDTVPRRCGSLLNSALSFLPEPPVPVPWGQPVCAMKPSMTR